MGELVVTRYTVGREQRHEALTVERTHEDRDTWAIRRMGHVWTRNHEWEYEPMPSSRDDDFLARARWTHDEACAEAVRVWSEERAEESSSAAGGSDANG